MKTPDKIDNIIVPRWFLEVVENTLQIQNNINFDEKFEETCQDRNIKESLNGLRKLLKGEELTGMERLEGLQHSLPSNLNEAAKDSWAVYEYRESPRGLYSTCYVDGFKAGAEWMAGQGWIDDGSMPTETKQESDTLQGHREWTESKPVLAWDSMYGCLVDWTINGKWMSEQTGGYTGQVCHGIIAWRPIPEYNEKH